MIANRITPACPYILPSARRRSGMVARQVRRSVVMSNLQIRLLPMDSDRTPLEKGKDVLHGAARAAPLRQSVEQPWVLPQRPLDAAQRRERVELRARNPTFGRQAQVHGLRLGRRRQRLPGRVLRGGADRARQDQADREGCGKRERHSTNHAVNTRHATPDTMISTSTMKPPPAWNRTNCPARLTIDPMEKTARELRPMAEKRAISQGAQGATHRYRP